ncbi:MAG: hypothetical protein JXR88_12030 [Clostridia bacterium]|nr:hypothetical protein [Clostridia bacterium]
MKKILIIILTLAFLMIGCNQNQAITLTEYNEKYTSLMSTLQNHLNDFLLPEAKDMISYADYQVAYSHEDFMHYIHELTSLLDDTLYELEIIGPQLENVMIQKYQSKLEYALYDLMQILKEEDDLDIFNTMWPSQFTLYDEMYQLNTKLNPYILKVLNYRIAIESELMKNDIIQSESFHEDYLKAMASYSYYSNVLAVQVSTYQDYAGLQTNPNNPNRLQTSEKKWYSIYELDYSVMLPQEKFNKSFLSSLEQYEQTLQLNPEKTSYYKNFILHFNQTYNDYVAIRQQLPYEFYKNGDHKAFQHKIGMIVTRGWYVKDEPLYDFDPIYNDAYHFDRMVNAFSELFNLLYESDHSQYMLKQ